MPKKSAWQEIPRTEWAALRDLYGSRRTSASSFYMLQNYIDLAQKIPDKEVKIFALNGEWRQDGTFVLKDTNQYYCNTLSENLDRLVAALNCIDEESSYLICGFPDRLLPAITAHLEFAGVSRDAIKPESTFWYHIPIEETKWFTVEPPKGITLKRMEPFHAEQVNSIWPHRSPGSIKFVEGLILYNLNVGAFDEAGNLVAWCLRLPLGSLGLLQVVETHKRMGFGSLMVKYMAKQLAEMDAEIMAPVVLKNKASQAMFEKLGFRVIDKVHWIMKH